MKIGVFTVDGMPGVRKSTLLKIINKSENVIKNFDVVIWATISQNHDIIKVQTDIAKRLGLSLQDDSTVEE